MDKVMTSMDAFYQAREHMVDALKADLIGSAADEVIHELPLNRFVAGILYPQSNESPAAERRLMTDVEEGPGDQDEAPDQSISLSHVRQPSAFGLSFSTARSSGRLRVVVDAARYVHEEGIGWHRKPFHAEETIELAPENNRQVSLAEGLALRIVTRKPQRGVLPVTMALVNTLKRPEKGYQDGVAWYQVEMTVRCSDGFVDRPQEEAAGIEDEDVLSNQLLFRQARNLAIGHGCAVEWDDSEPVTELRMSFIPTYEVPGSDTAVPGVKLSMSALAVGQGLEELHKLVALYREWIDGEEARIGDLGSPTQRSTALVHVQRAREAAERIHEGLRLLESDDQALRAFSLMNEAMLSQRNKQDLIRSGSTPADQSWRPFQIAFVLMNLRSLTYADDPYRDVADLLWFPTGGGKTEAYLGLIGYAILMRRLRNPAHGGVSVLMRYTLRLLTLQQFERAAGLICALEIIRRREMPDAEGVSLGLWVGRASSPNTVKEAKTALKKLQAGQPLAESNPVQLHTCPWCGAVLSPDDYGVQGAIEQHLVVSCPNGACEFSDGLPVHTIDDDVYAARPSLVIGTVDKFAMLAWRAEAQSLFSSDQRHPSPDLIVQDELHLISGPLGTMVGLYEAAVDAAASLSGQRPKLIASTATIRRAVQQVRSVFDREARQFPPPGLDSDDSFFATIADRSRKGTRQYIGVLSQNATHTYMLVRTYAALLQSAQDLPAPDEVKDAYWTLIGYFNSLRVLGGAAIQATDDVPSHMGVIARRNGTEHRKTSEPQELTSRIPSSEIPEQLRRLGVGLTSNEKPLDVVLATNMISVGLDVDRLGLMAVMGQPQATAEYIQATSRVGRSHPGLVVVIYNAARSRDLSHYESFSSFHRALYRHVEPNSATPFSPRARDRGLHGCLVAYARNTVMALNEDTAASKLAADPALLDPIIQQLVERAQRIAPDQASATRQQLRQLTDDWIEAAAAGLKYAGWKKPDGALLTEAVPNEVNHVALPVFPVSTPAWSTLTSLRDVDAVSSLYIISERKRP